MNVKPPIFMALLVFVSGLNAATTTPSPVPTVAPKTPKANYPIQTLPTAHASPFVSGGLPHTQHGPAWLDNRRVLFFGALPNKELETRGLFIWDVVANTVSQYSSHVRFCYADGYIVAFGASPPRTDPERPALVPVRYGQIGKEKDDICDIKTRKGCPPAPKNMSCKPGEYTASPLRDYPNVEVDFRNEHGAILSKGRAKNVDEGGPSKMEERKAFYDYPLILHNKQYPAGKPLPITAIEEIKSHRSGYSEYLKRYVLLTERPTDGEFGRFTIWPPGRAQPVYLMSSDGTVETIQVPSRSSWSTIHLAMPSWAGMVFMGSGGYQEQWGGLFLYDGREVWDLDRGRMETLAVSPDGCRVAYAINNDYGKTRNVHFNSIKSINFCGGEK
jgi:hypothetical protein